MLQTIQKIGPILDLFSVERPDWGVTEVAEAIGVPRSSTHALLTSLVETGLLQRRARGRYRLGWRVVELNETLRSTADLRTVAYPILAKLAELYGETVHLAVLEHGRALYLDKIVGNRQLTVTGARVGVRLEAHCSAVGKMLLAHRPRTEITRMLAAEPLRRFTPSTVTDPIRLAEEFAKIRASGTAFELGEAVPDVSCVAAPVYDEAGAVVAAVSMSVPSSRFQAFRVEYRQATRSAGAAISRRLTGSDEPALAVLPDGRDETATVSPLERPRPRAVSIA